MEDWKMRVFDARAPGPSYFLVISASPSRTNDASPTSYICISNDQTGNDQMSQLMTTIIPRAGSAKSVSSDMEPSRSTMLPPLDKNLLVTDSSSYASVNDPSSSSYHTAIENDSSHSGYKTPTPPTNDETLSLHSSLSDLSHTETLEPQPEGNSSAGNAQGERERERRRRTIALESGEILVS